jgi:hypothetical protein
MSDDQKLAGSLLQRAYWRKELGEFTWEKSVDYHLDRLRATEAGAALIRQAEERDDAVGR